MELRDYQRRVLEELARYLVRARQVSPKTAFIEQTETVYRTVPQLPDVPYVCLKVPTGGGKTLIAGRAVPLVAREFLHRDRVLVVWLVPTTAIRDQTLKQLRDVRSPLRRAVAGGGADVTVMDVSEALSIGRADLDGSTVVIVDTIQTFRVDKTEGRKVYEPNGALMTHAAEMTAAAVEAATAAGVTLDRYDGSADVVPSLVNVIRSRRPVVIIDEAHNARTDLSFETLARLSPSCVVELTATPRLEHKPPTVVGSNVLAQASAAELKAAEMIKLPIEVTVDREWEKVVSGALGRREALERVAAAEAAGGRPVRPILLFAAESQSKADPHRITPDALERHLVETWHVEKSWIAVETGSRSDLAGVDVLAADCPVRIVITVAKLREGWDCPFAYVLGSVAKSASATAIEQILGRVLRLPGTKRAADERLNRAYAFAVGTGFNDVAERIRQGLIDSGFEKLEADAALRQAGTAAQRTLPGAEDSRTADVVVTVADAGPVELTAVPPALRSRTSFDAATGTLTVRGGVAALEIGQLAAAFGTKANDPAQATASQRVVAEALTAATAGRAAEPGSILVQEAGLPRLDVPALAIVRQGVLEVFDETHFREEPLDLRACNAALSPAEFPDVVTGQTGTVDVTEGGNVSHEYARALDRQLSLIGREPNWTEAELVGWLARTIRHDDVTHPQMTGWLVRVIADLRRRAADPPWTVDRIAAEKFRLRDAVADAIKRFRHEAGHSAWQKALFGSDGDAAELTVTPERALSITAETYTPDRYYEGPRTFRRHLFGPTPVAAMNDEEASVAAEIDRSERVATWVRNLERRPRGAFWLPTSTDRFYPDFVAKLVDGRWLVVESKGGHLDTTDDSKEKQSLGRLWQDRSGGRGVFRWVTAGNVGPLADVLV